MSINRVMHTYLTILPQMMSLTNTDVVSTKVTNDIIRHIKSAEKFTFSISYACRGHRTVKEFHTVSGHFFRSGIEYFHKSAYYHIFQRLEVSG